VPIKIESYFILIFLTIIIISDKDENNAQSGRRSNKSKRVRTIFTPEQLERLEAEFERQQYMVGPERLYLASSLNLTEAQVSFLIKTKKLILRCVS